MVTSSGSLSRSTACVGQMEAHFEQPSHQGPQRLPPHAFFVVQGQHDGADHGDEKDQSGRLEQIDIFRIEDQPERRGAGTAPSSAGPSLFWIFIRPK